MLPEEKSIIQTRWSLVQRLKDRDDHESWLDFFETYSRLIFSFGLKTGLNESEAQDCLQETMIEVSKRIQEFHAERAAGSFKAWILRLCRWKIGDQFKKRRRDQRLFNRSVCIDDESDSDHLLGLISTESEFEALWNKEWSAHQCRILLDKLKARIHPKHYQIYCLLMENQRTPAEIAKSMNINIGQVYVVKHRANRILRELHASQPDLS